MRVDSAAAYYDSRALAYVDGSFDRFEACIKTVLQRSTTYSSGELRSMTFKELCKRLQTDVHVDDLIRIFGYRCEFEYMNAYDACRTFQTDFVAQQYYMLASGLSELCERMARDVCRKGGRIRLEEQVEAVTRRGAEICVTSQHGDYVGDDVIFAIKPHQMMQFSILRPVRPYLSKVRAGKLLRIYAKFPLRMNGPWFAGMKKTTTDSFLRQIIPVSENQGLIMISYTDGADVDFFLRKGRVRSDVQEVVMKECRRLFGRIPEPTYFKAHYWSEGCHYWRPDANSGVISRRLIHPAPNIYTCGEGFSTKQAWMEGALETAAEVVQRLCRGCADRRICAARAMPRRSCYNSRPSYARWGVGGSSWTT